MAEAGSLPAAAAAARRRFLSSRMASREGAGEADLDAAGLMTLTGGGGVSEVLIGRFFTGRDRGLPKSETFSEAGLDSFGTPAVALGSSAALAVERPISGVSATTAGAAVVLLVGVFDCVV